jgi:hypothetical protein
MNTTRMPGFAADASIYRSETRYYAQRTSEPKGGKNGTVHPAMRMQTFCEDYGSVHMCCIVWDSGQFCWESTNFWY